MRLVIDLQGAQSGSRYRGIGRYALSLAKAIAGLAEHDEILLALSDRFPETIDSVKAAFTGVLPPENIRVWSTIGPTREDETSNRGRRDVAERMREAFLAGLQPDVILISSLFEGFTDDALTSVELLNTSIPTVVILYDLIPLVHPDDNFRANAGYRAWYLGKLEHLKKARLLLAISESSRQDMLHAGSAPTQPVVNISGAHDPFFRSVPLSAEDEQSIRIRLGIDRAFVMYTGGGDDSKNLRRLIKAYGMLPKSLRRNHQLVLVGQMPDGQVQRLLHMARINGLADDDIVITGYVSDPDLLALYNCCALFVFPSLYEGFGLPPLEAMACGAAVIASNATSVAEIVGLSEALFDPTSVEAISSKMRLALTDQQFRTLLAEHGKKQSEAFSWGATAEKALLAMRSLVPEHKRRISRLVTVERTSIFKERALRILVIKIDHLGDFLLSIPALSKLRARYPYASIDAVVGSWNVSVARALNFFENIYSYDFFKPRSSDRPSRKEDDLALLLGQLEKYDFALDLRRQPEARFLISRVNAGKKFAFACFDETINGSLDVALPVYEEAAFVATPLNKTPISTQMIRIVDSIPSDPNDFVSFPTIGQISPRQAGAVAIFPKAGSAVREWRHSNFESLIEMLDQDLLVRNINVYFANAADATSFNFMPSGKLSLHVGLPFEALTESLSRNSVCVANNSGGAHLASYLGITVISIYSGHELASEWGPQFFDGIVMHRAAECAPCHGGTAADCPNSLFCLSDISVGDVHAKVLEALAIAQARDSGSSQAMYPDIAFQGNTDWIVRRLLTSIAQLREVGEISEVDIAVAIAHNHPDFSMSPDLKSFSLNLNYDHRSARIEWRGFSTIEKRFRWTDGPVARMSFECPNETPTQGVLLLHIATFGKQRILINLNGVKVLESVESGRHVHLRIPVHNLQPGFNILEFELPDARLPDNGDTRKLGIAVRDFEISVRELGQRDALARARTNSDSARIL